MAFARVSCQWHTVTPLPLLLSLAASHDDCWCNVRCIGSRDIPRPPPPPRCTSPPWARLICHGNDDAQLSPPTSPSGCCHRGWLGVIASVSSVAIGLGLSVNDATCNVPMTPTLLFPRIPLPLRGWLLGTPVAQTCSGPDLALRLTPKFRLRRAFKSPLATPTSILT